MASLEDSMKTQLKGARTSSATGYMLANPAYARDVWNNSQFDQGTAYTNAAARSGVVNTAGYKAIPTNAESNAQRSTRGTSAMNTGTGHAGPFPNMPAPSRGYTVWSGQRFRTAGDMWKSTGWRSQLTQSSGPNKAFALGGGGRGQSSEDSTTEVYSTEETRMGTRAWFTDEIWNEAKGKFAQSWAGYKSLGPTDGTPFLNVQQGQMFKRENLNVGFARRVKRGL